MKGKVRLKGLAIFAALIMMAVWPMACDNSSPGSKSGGTLLLPPGEDPHQIFDPNDTVEIQITMTVPGVDNYDPKANIGPLSVIPGVAVPFELFGSLIGQIDFGDRSLYDPWLYSVPYPVVGGQFNQTFTIPVGATWHLGFKTQGKMAAHNITVGSTTMQYACILGDPATYYTWGVVSFMVQRDQNGVVTVIENPNCTAVPVVGRLVRNGDSQVNLYDDNPFLPYDGVNEGPMLLQTSAADWPTQQTMATFIAGTGWVEDFYLYATALGDVRLASAHFSVYQDAVRRTAEPPINPTDPGLGGLYLRIFNAAGTVGLCTAPANTELRHWIDIDQTATHFYSGAVQRIDRATYCPVMLAENRHEIL